MIQVHVIIGDYGVVDPVIYLPCIPREGDNIDFPPDYVKWTNGASLDPQSFKVNSVTYNFDGISNCTVSLFVQQNK